MNVQLKDITVTARDGRVSHLDQVYIRGSHVRFFIVPDMLRYVHETPRLSVVINQIMTVFTGTEMPLCSDLVVPAAVVSVLPVVGLLLTGLAVLVVAAERLDGHLEYIIRPRTVHYTSRKRHWNEFADTVSLAGLAGD